MGVEQATGGAVLIKDNEMNLAYGSYKNRTDTGAISTGACALNGFYVNSTSSGTLAFTDGGVAITGTITPAVGWHWLPIATNGALAVTVGATINVTFSFVPTPSGA